ncbi:MAG TPA: PQQ-binding-like beta-propeller repeat protein [Chitinophaga sp.]|uniref:outer membrane protein assembly factor BamB family protein n=1 Tax=Chitinophaga sp. TaxID=1869181 RepID=UPI002BCBEF20|nr:PQQ-binding-like beta-propeller repeat protein [Chitinophaga sp.]HVI45798.1 PQQ-binding-like beta-propeller repeat protein [Chitinophaga sp.]
MKQFCLTILFLIACIGSYAQTPTGRQLWKYQTGDKVIATPLIAGQYIYYGSTDGYVYCHLLEDGRLKWKTKLGFPVRSSASAGPDQIFVGCEDGNIYAINMQSGSILWKFKTKGEKEYDLWDYYRSTPQYHNGKVFAGSGDGNIYCINATNGSEHWRFATNGIVHADPVIDKDTLFIGSFDGYFYALNTVNGQLIWKFKTVGDRTFPKGEVQKAALVTNDAVYFGSRDYNIYAIDKKTGTGLWNMKERGSWVTATPYEKNNNIFFGTSDTHAFYCLGNVSGKIRWKTAIPMRSYTTPVSYDTLIFTGCHNGYIYGIGQASGAIKWTFQTAASKKNYAAVYADDGHFRKDFQLYTDEITTKTSEQKILQLGSVISSPVIKDGIIYFGSTDGCMYAVKIDG